MNTSTRKAFRCLAYCLTIYALTILVTGCSTAREPWTTANKATCAAMWTTQVIDGLQYERDKDHPNIRESNPNITDGNIWLFKLGTPAIATAIGHFLPAKTRNWLFGGMTVCSTIVIINNERVKADADSLRNQRR